jgi:membrane protein required for colicin V production
MEWPALGAVDLVMLAVLALSTLIGALRGLTFELLSLAGWVAAWFAGLWLGPVIAPHLPVGNPGSALNGVAAFASAFLVVLVLWGLGARVVSALIAKTVLRPLDRLLGAVFGLVRGLVVLLAVATFMAFTPLGATEAWRTSVGAVWLNAVLGELMPLVAPGRGEPAGARSV